MTKNEHGVYLDYQSEIVAQRGRSTASVDIARCDDGLFRFSTRLQYTNGGFIDPITDRDAGYQTFSAAKEAGISRLLTRLPKPYCSEPQSVHDELKDLQVQLERQIAQPSLF